MNTKIKENVSDSMQAKRVRLIDIAEGVGVSRATVAKVLLGSGKGNVRVGRETAQRIRDIARKMNYFPNNAAQRLAGKRSNLIGVIIDSIAPVIHYEWLAVMERHAASLGYRFMVGQSHGEFDRLAGYLRDFSSQGVDGVLCISHAYEGSGESITNLFSHHSNIVFVGEPLIKSENSWYVAFNLAGGIEKAIDHLVEIGKSKIALFMRNTTEPTLALRYQGYQSGLKKKRLEYRPELVFQYGGTGEDELKLLKDNQAWLKLAKELLELDIDAVLAQSDIIAVQLIKAMKKLGVEIPRDIAVIGCDNVQVSWAADPELTTVDLTAKELAVNAVNLLIARIEGKDLKPNERQLFLEPSLIIRESTTVQTIQKEI